MVHRIPQLKITYRTAGSDLSRSWLSAAAARLRSATTTAAAASTLWPVARERSPARRIWESNEAIA